MRHPENFSLHVFSVSSEPPNRTALEPTWTGSSCPDERFWHSQKDVSVPEDGDRRPCNSRQSEAVKLLVKPSRPPVAARRAVFLHDFGLLDQLRSPGWNAAHQSQRKQLFSRSLKGCCGAQMFSWTRCSDYSTCVFIFITAWWWVKKRQQTSKTFHIFVDESNGN